MGKEHDMTPAPVGVAGLDSALLPFDYRDGRALPV